MQSPIIASKRQPLPQAPAAPPKKNAAATSPHIPLNADFYAALKQHAGEAWDNKPKSSSQECFHSAINTRIVACAVAQAMKQEGFCCKKLRRISSAEIKEILPALIWNNNDLQMKRMMKAIIDGGQDNETKILKDIEGHQERLGHFGRNLAAAEFLGIQGKENLIAVASYMTDDRRRGQGSDNNFEMVLRGAVYHRLSNTVPQDRGALKLLVEGIPSTATEEQIRDHFKRYGDAKIDFSGRKTGCGSITVEWSGQSRQTSWKLNLFMNVSRDKIQESRLRVSAVKRKRTGNLVTDPPEAQLLSTSTSSWTCTPTSPSLEQPRVGYAPTPFDNNCPIGQAGTSVGASSVTSDESAATAPSSNASSTTLEDLPGNALVSDVPQGYVPTQSDNCTIRQAGIGVGAGSVASDEIPEDYVNSWDPSLSDGNGSVGTYLCYLCVQIYDICQDWSINPDREQHLPELCWSTAASCSALNPNSADIPLLNALVYASASSSSEAQNTKADIQTDAHFLTNKRSREGQSIEYEPQSRLHLSTKFDSSIKKRKLEQASTFLNIHTNSPSMPENLDFPTIVNCYCFECQAGYSDELHSYQWLFPPDTCEQETVSPILEQPFREFAVTACDSDALNAESSLRFLTPLTPETTMGVDP